MAVSVNDPIAGPARGAFDQAVAYCAGGTDVAAYAHPLWSYAIAEGLDPLALFGQFCDETAKGTSDRWKANRNPAGLAIVQSGDPDPGKWTPDGAAAVHVAAMLIALRRPAKSPVLQAATNAMPGATVFLERFRAKYSAPQCPAVSTIADLCAHYVDAKGEAQATWAWNPNYANQIVGHMRNVLAMPIAVSGGGAMSKPRIFITAGHRNTTGGDPEESNLTPAMARAYRDAFRAAGYAVAYLQDNPQDWFNGNLDDVGRAVLQWGQSTPGQLVFLDVHYEGEAASINGCFAIPPDEAGLIANAPNGNPGNDTWANNPLDVQLARQIATNLSAATGLPKRTVGVTEPGVMSERLTGVGGQGYRLAMFGWTAPVRDRMVRLVVEHGNHYGSIDRGIIFQNNFTDKCAPAVVAAVNAVYGVSAQPSSQPTPDPAPKPQPQPAPKPAPYPTPALPKWWASQLALKFPTDQTAYGAIWVAARRKSVVARPTAQRISANDRSRKAGVDLAAGDVVHVERLIKANDGGQWAVLHAGGKGVEGARVKHDDLTDTPDYPS